MNQPLVSVILVCRNEEMTIRKSLLSLIKQSYEPYEIVVVDGKSTDKTVEIVREIKRDFSNIKIINNEKIYTPHGLNLGIKESKGDFILIAGAHTEFSKDYIKESVKFLLSHPEADAVGGVSMAKGLDKNNCIQNAISYAYSSVFGTAAKHRYYTKEPREIDTVAYACYKRDVFEKVGYFDEKLIRNQDIEFNYRMRKHNLKIFLIPQINYYYVPSKIKLFLKKNFSNGYWNYITLINSPYGISIRHFIPFLFSIYIIFLILFLIFSKNFIFNFVFLIPLIFYFILDVYFSSRFSIKLRNLKLFFCSLLVFPSLHISYGLGTLFSIIRGGKKEKQSIL
ncbi:hypothetical protein PW5551_08800 [Petrotoga sp. 9PW.55.5.1]|nr:hypothetical protein PW5551_08800 [Petrotoga sp. 9PW.55.5.1]